MMNNVIESFICVQCGHAHGDPSAKPHYDLCAECGEEQRLDALEDEDEEE